MCATTRLEQRPVRVDAHRNNDRLAISSTARFAEGLAALRCLLACSELASYRNYPGLCPQPWLIDANDVNQALSIPNTSDLSPGQMTLIVVCLLNVFLCDFATAAKVPFER